MNFSVRRPDHGEDWYEVDATDAEAAAEAVAERLVHNDPACFRDLEGDGELVLVRGPDGKHRAFRVSAELVPVFSAREAT